MAARKHRFPWLLLALTAAVLSAVLALSHGLAPYDGVPFSLVVDGDDLTADVGLLHLDPGARLLLSAMAVGVGLWLLVAVPLALTLALALALAAVVGLVLLALVGTLGLPLLALGLVLGLLALPVLLGVWLLKWLLR